MTRALIDAEFHDTPIGRCVVLPAKFATTFDPLTEADVLAVVETCPTCSGGGNLLGWDVSTEAFELDSAEMVDCMACDAWGHVRRGFVRVVETLPAGRPATKPPHGRFVTWGFDPSGVAAIIDGDKPAEVLGVLPISPGDVVLVTEPDCDCDDGKVWTYRSTGPFYAIDCADCAPSTVRVIHRDGVLGEIET